MTVRFEETFTAALARGGALASAKVWCPNILDGDKDALTARPRQARTIDDLPDAMITTGAATLLNSEFRPRFLDTRLLVGFTRPAEASALPPMLAETAPRSNDVVGDFACAS